MAIPELEEQLRLAVRSKLPKARIVLDENGETPRRQKVLYAFKEFLKDPLFIPRYNVSLRYERELALERLKKIADAGYISVFDFEENPLNIFAAHEGICG